MDATLVTETLDAPGVTLTVVSRGASGKPMGGYARFPDGYDCSWQVGPQGLSLYGARGAQMRSPKRSAPIEAALAAPAPAPTQPITPVTRPLAYAYASARCASRRACDRYAPQAEMMAAQAEVVRAGGVLRKADRPGWLAVRAALEADKSLTNPSEVLQRANEHLPA